MRINREIRADRLRVIAEDGSQLGVMTLREALMRAESAGLDLVEISPQATPPVAKIIDYGKFRYLRQKKDKDSKKSQVQIKVKEIKFKPNIDVHDMETKAKQARDFLLKGNKVRVTCTFRGREILHRDLGEKVMRDFFQDLSDVAAIEAPAKFLGKTLSAVLIPSGKKPKPATKRSEGVGEKTI